jgi:hypothetical protein
METFIVESVSSVPASNKKFLRPQFGPLSFLSFRKAKFNKRKKKSFFEFMKIILGLSTPSIWSSVFLKFSGFVRRNLTKGKKRRFFEFMKIILGLPKPSICSSVFLKFSGFGRQNLTKAKKKDGFFF